MTRKDSSGHHPFLRRQYKASDHCHGIPKACQNHRESREPLPLKSTVGRHQHVGADGYRALPVTGSNPFLLRSSLLAAVWYPSKMFFLSSFCRWVSPGGGCGCNAESALFVQSLQCCFNHKGGAACPAPVLCPRMLTELGETTAGKVHRGFGLQS